MKNTLLFLVSLIYFSFSPKAQVWIDNGAIWHYDFWNVAVEGFYEIEYTKDTLIEGHDCQVIEGVRYMYGGGIDGDFALIGETNLQTQFTYVSGDTVFYRNNDEFFVLFNFGATAGDSWIISTIPFDVCDDTSYIEVLETGTIEIDGTTYRTITVEPSSNSSVGFSGIFVERFGNITTGFGPFHDLFPHFYECDSIELGIIEWDYTRFGCFEDESFSLYNPDGEDCTWWRTNLSIENQELEPLLFYPNPSSDYITIEGVEPNVDYAIYDLSGKKLKSGIMPKDIIDIRALESGIYLLKIENHTVRFSIR